jgi:single-strand DNA-binding protein
MLFDDINEVRLLGNITNDPDLRFTPNGTAVLNFGMATNRRYKAGEEWKDETTFHNIVVWSTLAQGVAQRANKGTRVLVSGRIQVRTWDGNDGKKNYKTEVVADNVILIDRYNKGKSSELPDVQSLATSGSGKSTAQESPDASVDTTIDPDELPF